MDKLVNMCFQADFPLSDTFGVTGSQVEAVINAVFSEGEGATQEVRNEIAFAAIERTMWLRGCVHWPVTRLGKHPVGLECAPSLCCSALASPCPPLPSPASSLSWAFAPL